MNESKLPAQALASLGLLWAVPLVEELLPTIRQIAQLVQQFRSLWPTPGSSFRFEKQVDQLMLEVARLIVQWTYNHIEPADPDLMPAHIHYAGEDYRNRRRKTPNRFVATLFGTITLWRALYEPLEPGEHALFPLEICLGLHAGIATPALADRVGQYAAESTQKQVMAQLLEHHGVHWSVETLRNVTAAMAEPFGEHRHAAQVAKVLGWLEQADRSKGNRKPVLAVGRDGVFLPIRHETKYRQGATATMTVYDRAQRRLGTVYLGQMPEPGQTTLTEHLTRLIEDVLGQYAGPLPRLEYVTDAGDHETDYYESVLRHMSDPRHPDRYLVWQRVVDYYHACERVSKLAETLFGPGREAHAWSAKMRKRLKTKPGGVNRVLHSAAALRHRRGLVGSAHDFDTAYDYLRARMAYMDYGQYKHLGLSIGSGVTEAGCKTVFTQRLKQSGMSWEKEGGQNIVNLRVVYLSGIWNEVRQAHLSSVDLSDLHAQLTHGHSLHQNAA